MVLTKQVYYTPDLCKLADRSREWLRQSIRNGTVPRPIRVGKRNAWPKPVIERLFGLDLAAPVAGASEAGQ